MAQNGNSTVTFGRFARTRDLYFGGARARRAAQPVDAIEVRLTFLRQSTCPCDLSSRTPASKWTSWRGCTYCQCAFHGKLLSFQKRQNVRPQRMFSKYVSSNYGACIARSRRRTQHVWLQIRLRTKRTSNQPQICTRSKVMPVYAESTFVKWMVN